MVFVHKLRIAPSSFSLHPIVRHCSCRASSDSRGASLRQHQRELTRQVLDVLSNTTGTLPGPTDSIAELEAGLNQPHKRSTIHDPSQDRTEPTALHTLTKLVDQGVVTLVASTDWQHLQQAFHQAESTYNAAAAAAAPTATAGLGALQGSLGSSFAAAVPQSHIRSSPWGFAMRQPGQKKAAVQQPVSPAPQQAGPGTAAEDSKNTAHNQQQQQQQQQQWNWQSVQQFVVLGLGSIGKLRENVSGSSTPASPSSRLGFRFFQLVVAKALQQTLLCGLSGKPQVYDPDFDSFDQELLSMLGFEVLKHEPSHRVACPTVMYMPCCPRDVYNSVLEANSDQLQQLAIFGTSMRSLAETQGLLEALGSPSSSSSSSNSSSSNSSSSNSSSSSSSGSPGQREHMQLAYREGKIIEVVAPDCAAHGVGVAVHLFRR